MIALLCQSDCLSIALNERDAYTHGHCERTDVVEELEKLAVEVAAGESNIVFVAGQVVFQQETLAKRLLHNEVAFALQRRLSDRGLDVVIVPVQLPKEVW